MANKSTPLNRAIFVCSTRTPKENNKLKFELVEFLSMVACNGKGFALCYVPLVVVFQPVTRYRPNPGKFSGSFHQSLMDTVMKRFKFLTGSRLIITIYANNRQEAENKIKWASKPLCIGLNLPSIKGVAYA
ncbi:hypothetical protein [Mannheimia granulomatis]